MEQNKLQLLYAILDDDMVNLACEWMDGYELVEQDGETYYDLENGERFPYPVTTQSFLESLHLAGMNVSYHGNDEVPDKFLFDLFFETMPDFFACHNIEVFLTAGSDGSYQINVNGLAG